MALSVLARTLLAAVAFVAVLSLVLVNTVSVLLLFAALHTAPPATVFARRDFLVQRAATSVLLRSLRWLLDSVDR